MIKTLERKKQIHISTRFPTAFSESTVLKIPKSFMFRTVTACIDFAGTTVFDP